MEVDRAGEIVTRVEVVLLAERGHRRLCDEIGASGAHAYRRQHGHLRRRVFRLVVQQVLGAAVRQIEREGELRLAGRHRGRGREPHAHLENLRALEPCPHAQVFGPRRQPKAQQAHRLPAGGRDRRHVGGVAGVVEGDELPDGNQPCTLVRRAQQQRRQGDAHVGVAGSRIVDRKRLRRDGAVGEGDRPTGKRTALETGVHRVGGRAAPIQSRKGKAPLRISGDRRGI